MKIVADDKIPFLKGVFEPYASMVYLPGNMISTTDIADADAIITRSITKCNSKLLKNSGVKFIASATIGDDHIDKDYCSNNNIQWTNAKGCNASAVEQYITSALVNLAVGKEIELENLAIGIIGVGNIGKRVKRVAEILGLKVLLNDPPRAEKENSPSFIDLHSLLDQADILTLHVPLCHDGKNKTFHLADEDFFNSAKQCKIFINSSRGEVVETSAIKKAITDVNLITILDVWENEPNIDAMLVNHVEYGTPHIAGYSMEGKAKGTAMCVNAISQYFGFELENWLPEMNKSGTFKYAIDCIGKSREKILQEAINICFDIKKNNSVFKQEFNSFEQLRRNYKFRWEAGNYTIELKNNNQQSGISKLLTQLGFKILN